MHIIHLCLPFGFFCAPFYGRTLQVVDLILICTHSTIYFPPNDKSMRLKHIGHTRRCLPVHHMCRHKRSKTVYLIFRSFGAVAFSGTPVICAALFYCILLYHGFHHGKRQMINYYLNTMMVLINSI